MKAKVVESRVWVGPSGRTFSLYSSWKEPGSELVTKGYTIAWPDGTVGTGKPAFTTKAEAEAALAKYPANFPGMNVY